MAAELVQPLKGEKCDDEEDKDDAERSIFEKTNEEFEGLFMLGIIHVRMTQQGMFVSHFFSPAYWFLDVAMALG
jgi:hypothetical protein